MPEEPHDDAIVFICYAHEDNKSRDPREQWLNRLLKHLTPLEWDYHVKFWSSPNIQTGDDWHREIQSELKSAKVSILLISSNFIFSGYIRKHEMPSLLEQERAGKTKLIPIHIGPSREEATYKYPHPDTGPERRALSDIQSANDPKVPLSALTWDEQEQVLVDITRQIAVLVPQRDPPAQDSPQPQRSTEDQGAAHQPDNSKWRRIILITTVIILMAVASYALLPERLAKFLTGKQSTETTLAPVPVVTLQIIKPVKDELVDKTYRVWGETPFPNWNHYLVVKPMKYTCLGLVQSSKVEVVKSVLNGSATFGNVTADRGKKFQVFVVATQAQLNAGAWCGPPQGELFSSPVTVIRK